MMPLVPPCARQAVEEALALLPSAMTSPEAIVMMYAIGLQESTIMIAALLWIGTLGSAYWYGVEVGDDHATAAVARENAIADRAIAAAVSGAASAIAAQRPKNVTIRQETAREIRTNTVYAECRHSPEQLQRINSAIAGGGAEPTGRGVVPGNGTADR